MVHIVRALFDGFVHFANTKQQRLISGGTVVHCRPMHSYLLNLHETLKVDEWIKGQKNRRNHNSVVVMDRLRAQLHRIDRPVVGSMNIANPTFVARSSFEQPLSAEPPLKRRKIENTEMDHQNENAFASPEAEVVHSEDIPSFPWSLSPDPWNVNMQRAQRDVLDDLNDECLIFPDYCCVSPNPFESFPFGTDSVDEVLPESVSTFTLNGYAGEAVNVWTSHCI